MKTKRTLSLILALVMVLSLCGISAYAEETKPNVNLSNILGDLANHIYEAVTGDEVDEQPITENHVCHPVETAYVCKNAFQHYVQWKCSCGRVLMAYDEAHHIGWDLGCSLCGYNSKGANHTHVEDHRTYTPVDANTHRVDVYCACGEIIKSFNEPHSFGDNGICKACGYDKNGGNGNGNGGNNDNGEGREPKSGEWNGHEYTIIYSKIDWRTAKALCEAVGRHLVTITSAEEQAFIESLNSDNDNCWIGGFFKGSDWTWVTDEAWDYTNWANTPANAAVKSCSAVFPKLWTNLKYNNLIKLDGFIMEGDGVTEVITK